MIRVYHHITPTFMASYHPKRKDYHPVAEVQVEQLESAYHLTNTIEMMWVDNDGVKFLGSPQHGMDGCRSTSVGDILERDGKFYMVQSLGFAPVNFSETYA